jgi:hypothetical protein
MPSQLHEALIEFRDRPELAAELLAGPVGLAIPEFDKVEIVSGELNDVIPTEYRADLVITLTKSAVAVLGVVIEVQLRPDSRKPGAIRRPPSCRQWRTAMTRKSG